MLDYCDPVIKADQCTKYVDDMSTAGISSERFNKNLRALLKCIQNAAIKFFVIKCRFGTKEVDFFEVTITLNRVTPQKQEITKCIEKLLFLQLKKHYKIHWLSNLLSE